MYKTTTTNWTSKASGFFGGEKKEEYGITFETIVLVLKQLFWNKNGGVKGRFGDKVITILSQN